MRAALRAGDGVHLVDDHGLDPAQRLARLRGQHQEERLRRRDQDVGRLLAAAPRALLRRRVARADADAELGLDPGERAAQVPLDVVVERLQRRDVEQAQARRRARGRAGRSRSRNAASVLPEPVGAWIRTCAAGGDRGPAGASAPASGRRTRARTSPASSRRRARAAPSREVTVGYPAGRWGSKRGCRYELSSTSGPQPEIASDPSANPSRPSRSSMSTLLIAAVTNAPRPSSAQTR